MPGMEDSEFGVPEIVRAVRMWREFRERADPTYRRPEVYAAAVEYIMVLFGFYGDSQASIAERYGASPSSVSSRWREIEGIPPTVPLGTGRGGRQYDTRVG